jgi:putative membrane protein
MVDQLTAMERVANTPIPSSCPYTCTTCFLIDFVNLDGIHLKQCVTLYLFALPFTLIYDLGWATIPVVTVVAFTFMGIEGIADEIEMPFGLFTQILILWTPHFVSCR